MAKLLPRPDVMLCLSLPNNWREPCMRSRSEELDARVNGYSLCARDISLSALPSCSRAECCPPAAAHRQHPLSPRRRTSASSRWRTIRRHLGRPAVPVRSRFRRPATARGRLRRTRWWVSIVVITAVREMVWSPTPLPPTPCPRRARDPSWWVLVERTDSARPARRAASISAVHAIQSARQVASSPSTSRR